MSDEETRLRRRHQQLADDASVARPGAATRSPTTTVQTVTAGAYPTAARSVFMVKRAKVTAAETEGAAVTVTTFGGAFACLNVGSAVPPSGTTTKATLEDGRWQFQYDG